MEKRTILILTPDLSKPGGIANYFSVIKNNFNLPVDYFTRGSRADSKGPLSALLQYFIDYYNFVKTLREHQYSLIHINTSLALEGVVRDAVFIFLAKAFFKKKIFVFFRGWDKKAEKSRGLLLVLKKIIFKADIIAVLGEEFKTKLTKWGYSGEIRLLTTVAAPDLFDNNIKIKRDENLLIFVSRLSKEKGIDLLLKIFSRLKNIRPNLRLIIAGDGEDREFFVELVRTMGLPDVEFPGFVIGIAKKKIYHQGSIFIFPSLGEGMPNALLEAMASGLPIVCSDTVGGVVDLFKQGEMGYMVHDRDIESFCQVIERLLDSELERNIIGAFNKKYAEENFSVNRVVSDLESIYFELSK